jgi:hypothetical protein
MEHNSQFGHVQSANFVQIVQQLFWKMRTPNSKNPHSAVCKLQGTIEYIFVLRLSGILPCSGCWSARRLFDIIGWSFSIWR